MVFDIDGGVAFEVSFLKAGQYFVTIIRALQICSMWLLGRAVFE